jgi:two-component system response regulator CiaR
VKGIIIEDDRILSDEICESLRDMVELTQAFDGEEGLLALTAGSFDVVIMDIMMPKISGFDLVSQIRREGIATPVLMLTALGRTADQVRCLNAGADDYLTKPFDIDVLQARLKAIVRRTKGTAATGDDAVKFLDLSVKLNTRTAKIGDARLDFPGKQFDMMVYLLEHRNVIVHKENLFQHVWGFYSSTGFSVVDVYASQIRKELQKHGYDKFFKTVRGIGYILTDDSALYG